MTIQRHTQPYSENETLSILYINYTHSTHEIVIVPEFPSFIIPPLFMIASLLAIVFRENEYFPSSFKKAQVASSSR